MGFDPDPRSASSPAHGIERRRFDRRQLTWADSFDAPVKRFLVRIVEYLSGKHVAIGLIREFERRQPPVGSAFWSAVLEVMKIDVRVPVAQLARIPRTGPVIVVANHPTGPLDGIVLAEIVSGVREDYKILTRGLMTVMETDFGEYLIPVPFRHHPNALRDGLRMRAEALAHLSSGGLLAYFPSGAAATSESWFGPPVEARWKPFTAKLIRKSRARVVPIRFFGGPTRLYQLGNKTSPVLRQGLLIHEIICCRGRAQSPIVGTSIPLEDLECWDGHPRAFMSWLRKHTLSLTY